MSLFYLLPFSYFFDTRLWGGSVAFHLIFEWVAAIILVLTIGVAEPAQALVAAGLCYLAFISLYEIGYIVNDLFSAKCEDGGRKRGPQESNNWWVSAWFGSRILVFSAVTMWLGLFTAPEWWSFFIALSAVFALHNLLQDREFKAATFLWLAWFRFMAPIIFVIEGSQLMGVGVAAAMSYTGFRIFGYLDSKALLSMPGRQRPSFRLFFFLMPLAGILALWPYQAAFGFVILSGYYAVVAVLGTVAGAGSSRVTGR